jgi:hypothetical protein
MCSHLPTPAAERRATRGSRLGALLVVALGLAVARPAVAGVSVVKELEFGDLPGLREVVIDHPLGALVIRGVARAGVRIRALKSASDLDTTDRLRVLGTMDKGRLDIRTRVLMPAGARVAAGRAQELQATRNALARLSARPTPWSEETRAEYRRLSTELYNLLRTSVKAATAPAADELQAVPLQGATLTLTVHVPSGVTVVARTFSGDIDVADLRGPVSATTVRGKIYARNVVGAVRTRSDRGNQYLTQIRGTLEADATFGDLQLQGITGDLISATLVRGDIQARSVSAPLVRFTTTQGGVSVTATVTATGRLVVRTHRGTIDVRLSPAVGFRLRAETQHGRLDLPAGFRRTGAGQAGRGHGTFQGGGGGLDLTSVYGDIRVR